LGTGDDYQLFFPRMKLSRGKIVNPIGS